jgi:predicted nucleic acid-binding protein
MPLVGGSILLDTTVYVDVLSGRSSEALEAFISFRICNHSSVCLAELTHLFGRLDPGRAGTARVLSAIRETIGTIPSHRLSAPEVDVWGASGILAGLLFRLGGFPRGAERKCLNDALIYLQARKLGCAVLSGNVKEFDYLSQLAPGTQVILYRRDSAFSA